MKILIVDDRADNQLLLREQLHAIAPEAVATDSGVRALHEMRRQSFDLVVTDLLMPEMDGLQLCYLLKSDPKLRNTPVVIYTANYATRKDEEQAKHLGADDFITRPIDEDQLTERIQSVLRRAGTGQVAVPHSKPDDSFFREYNNLLIQKLEDQLLTAEENARLLTRNSELAHELEKRNAELETTNQELQRANEDLEAFTYSVSHDLRAPIRAIKGMIDLLRDDVGGQLPKSALDYLGRIDMNADRMHALVTGLHAHSRMRHLDKVLHDVDLNTVMDTVLAGMDYAIAQSHAQVTVNRPLPVVLGHEEALVQILTNLVDNGMKYVAPGVNPQVTISAKRVGGRVRVCVEDNGIGIAPEWHDKVYAAFERLHPQAAYPGTGLGLAIVRRGVERMGGRVGLESQLNHGSIFWIELQPGSGRAA